MVRLMTAEDAFGAKVVVAQLGVEGILWELKGGFDGPYPFGPVQVFVAEADLAQAQAVLASTAPLDADRDEQDELDDLEALWSPAAAAAPCCRPPRCSVCSGWWRPSWSASS